MFNKKCQIGAGIIAIIIILVLIVGGTFASFYWRKYWLPKEENLKREVWENTNSRINGAIQDIAKRRIEYQRTEDEIERSAICASIRNSYPDITPEEIDDYTISQFFSKCKYGG